MATGDPGGRTAESRDTYLTYPGCWLLQPCQVSILLSFLLSWGQLGLRERLCNLMRGGASGPCAVLGLLLAPRDNCGSSTSVLKCPQLVIQGTFL